MRGDHAVVIGGSMAGLLAAQVLADHFTRVTVIEGDRFPDGPAFRAGVPQSRHTHILLARGRALLNQLFPGLDSDLRDAGAVEFEWPKDVLWLSFAGWGRRFRDGLTLLSCSRELLDWGVRRRLAARRHVRFLEACDVTGLLGRSGNASVAGVQIRHRPQDAAITPRLEDLPATLVVDASGRRSRTPQWLKTLGYAPPRETAINPFLGYASRYYARPRAFQADWKVLFIQGRPPACVRGGVLFPIDANRWLVTLAGASRDYPPTDEAGFLAFARSLRSPLLAEVITHTEPLSGIHGYRQTENRLRHYDRLRRWPERFLVLGDAVCALNPVYGQGMTVSAQAAVLLDQCLRSRTCQGSEHDLAGLPPQFQKQLARSNATAWLMATGEDFRFPATEGGRRGLHTRCMHWYFTRIVRVATENPRVSKAFAEVANLLAPPKRLLRPSILVAALTDRSHGLEAPPSATTSADGHLWCHEAGRDAGQPDRPARRGRDSRPRVV